MAAPSTPTREQWLANNYLLDQKCIRDLRAERDRLAAELTAERAKVQRVEALLPRWMTLRDRLGGYGGAKRLSRSPEGVAEQFANELRAVLNEVS